MPYNQQFGNYWGSCLKVVCGIAYFFVANKNDTLSLSIDLLKLLLPELLITHLNIISHSIEQDTVHLYFEEKKETPQEEKHCSLIGHGFHKVITV